MSVRARLYSLALGAGILAALVFAWQAWRSRPLADPEPAAKGDVRLSAAAIWPNIHPDVQYTGDESCAGCHASITRTYRQHPMGRSLSPVASASRIERFDAAAHDPFDAAGLRYRVERKGDALLHQEAVVDERGGPVAEITAEISYVVGSGQRGRAYLLDRSGYLFQSPITWYPQKAIWDLSPGYEQRNPHFTRPVIHACLFCHANHATVVSETTHGYQSPIFRGHAIGCERCHGPGELHVQARRDNPEAAGTDQTIINPRHLEHHLREAVCQQCHLQGQARVLRRGRQEFDYRPGVPLEEFLVDFVKPAEDNTETKFVGTVEQMYVSRCFRESRGDAKLGCISCHDPHVLPSPEQKVAFYRARCLNCHADKGCSLPLEARRAQNKDDSCVACHMPATGSDVNHTSISDHRISRRPDQHARPATIWPRPGMPPLVPFHPERKDRDEAHRDLGVALMVLSDQQPNPVKQWLAGEAMPSLEAALGLHPDDLAARDAQGDALWSQGRLGEAQAVYEGTLVLASRREFTLNRLTALALRLKRLDLAERTARRSLEVNPWRWQSHLDLATILAQGSDWNGAASSCRKVLELQPFNLPARSLLLNSLLQQRDWQQAKAQFETLAALTPADKREALRSWFTKQVP